MVRKTKRRLASCIMAFIMLLGVFPLSTAYAEDMTSVLVDLNVVVSQDGVDINESGTLTSKKPISVEIFFKVPVKGDSPKHPNPVKKGDTASILLSSEFKLISTGESIPLQMGALTVAHAKFETDPVTKMVVANIIFDGDDVVFDGTADTVKCEFSGDFEYIDEGGAGGVGDHIVTILNKTYTVNVPPAEIVYGVIKSGNADMSDKSIEWKVTVSAKQSGSGIDLDGYQFFDNLKDVGAYIPGSFTVDGNPETPSLEGDAIRYVFGSGSNSPKEIIFKTEIPDSLYYLNSEQKIVNKAALLNSSGDLKKDGKITVPFTPQWIEKKGEPIEGGSAGTYDPKNREIKWTITANQMEKSLSNVVITDLLPSGLTLKSAVWQEWNGTSWGAETPITPDGSGNYSLGDINSIVLLTIVSTVPDTAYSADIVYYKNSASISWDGIPGTGPGTGIIEVGIGYNSISKKGEAVKDSQRIHWTVTADAKNQVIPNMKVYDLIVYGPSGFDFSKVTGIPAGIDTDELSPRYNQKYVDLSFTGSGTLAVLPILQDGKRVADLLQISGLSNSVENKFEFDTLVLNPDIYAGNKTTSVDNTATLFSDTTYLNRDTASVDYESNLISKEMLKREAMADPAAGVNDKITDTTTLGFDYKEKAVIFRLSINADSLDLSNFVNADGDKLGYVTVTDKLPDGWVFADIATGFEYFIFEGTANPDGTVSAKSTTPDNGSVAGLSTSFVGETATFKFNNLDKPYVVLLKAKPTDETAAKYFDSNSPTTETNTMYLNAENWEPGVSISQDVKIESTLLEKTLKAPKNGQLLWTVDYKPYDLPQTGTWIEDKLPAGIELRTDSNGALLISGNITANEMTLNANGSYTLGDEVVLELNSNIFITIKTVF